MKYLLLFFVIFILGCESPIDSKEALKSILSIEDLSQVDFKESLIFDKIGNIPYTVYYKVSMDSLEYSEVKNRFENCREIYDFVPLKFESSHVSSTGNLHPSRIPNWFDPNNLEFNTWLLYNSKKLKVIECKGRCDAWIFMKFSEENLYIILDSMKQAD